MKKYKGLLLIFMFFMFLGTVEAKECKKLTESDIKIFFAGDFDNVPYCDEFTNTCAGNNNLCTSGCYPLTIASILASYGESVEPQNVSEYLCANFHWNAQNREYRNGITNSDKFQNDFNMTITRLNETMEEIDTNLSQGKVVMLSIKEGTGYSNGTHYLAVALKQDDQYYIMNTGLKEEGKYGWKSKSDVELLVNNINAGMYSVYPSECTSFTNSGSSGNIGGTTSDPYPEYEYPDFGGGKTDCTNIFKKANGELNDFGEFVQSIFTLMKVMAPVLVIVLSTIDYVKAIASSNAEEVKKANGRTIKRIIIGVLIFFLPFILDILFHLFGLYDLSRCGIGD